MRPEQHKVWTNHEVASLLEWRATRVCYRLIGKRMGRTYDSVRAKHRKLLDPEVKRLEPFVPPNVETMAIPKTEVPNFYELGWRFVGFSADGLCVMRKETKAQQ